MLIKGNHNAVMTEGHPETSLALRLTFRDGSFKAITIHYANISLE